MEKIAVTLPVARSDEADQPLEALIHCDEIVERVLGKQVCKPDVGNQAAGGFGGATEHDCVSLRGQFSGNRQRPRQQAEIIGGQGREQKLRQGLLRSLAMAAGHCSRC
jgi:hypothetical protein